MNSDWGRWIFASMSKAFVTAMTPLGVDLFIEGTYRTKPDDLELLEFRMDGPMRRKVSRNKYILDVEINILVRSHMDDTDFHKLRRLTGVVQEWLGQDHCIFRYGDGPDDDDSLLGTLTLKNRSPLHPVRLNQFGQIDEKFLIEEATVEGSFVMHLKGET